MIPMDLDHVEKSLFLSPHLRASKFRTTLFKPEENGLYQSDHLRIFIDAILNKNPQKVGVGEVFGVRDSYKAVQPRLSTEGGHKYDPAKDSLREKMLYQYVSPEKVQGTDSSGKIISSEESLSKKVRNFFKEHKDYLQADPSNIDKSKSFISRYAAVRFL